MCNVNERLSEIEWNKIVVTVTSSMIYLLKLQNSSLKSSKRVLYCIVLYGR